MIESGAEVVNDLANLYRPHFGRWFEATVHNPPLAHVSADVVVETLRLVLDVEETSHLFVQLIGLISCSPNLQDGAFVGTHSAHSGHVQEAEM